MLKNAGLVVLLTLAIVVSGFACRSDPGILTPDQIDSSMLDQVVKVKGKITLAIESPLGVGGMYMTLGNGEGEVDVRIQPDIWDPMTESEKAKFTEGRTVVVEGVLYRAGTVLVVVYGKYTLSSNTTSSNN